MSKKDFELIAAAIAASRMCESTASQVVQHRFTAFSVADALATTNPRFDRDRFVAACGVKS